jgi:hypothetical protein
MIRLFQPLYALLANHLFHSVVEIRIQSDFLNPGISDVNDFVPGYDGSCS